MFDVEARSGVLPARCPPCRAVRKRRNDAAKTARHRASDPDGYRAYDRDYQARRRLDPAFRANRSERELIRKYGVDSATYDQMVVDQGGRCVICVGPPVGPGKRLHVDHDHGTGAVRALLCAPCNTAIGLMKDDPERLRQAAAYLEGK